MGMINVQREAWMSNSWHMHMTTFSERGNGSVGRLAFRPFPPAPKNRNCKKRTSTFPTPHEALCQGVFVFWLVWAG